MQVDPDIHNQQRQAHQQEAQAGTRRRDPRPHLLYEPVATLDSEAPAVPFAHPQRWIGDLQTDVQQPGGRALARPTAMVGVLDPRILDT